MPSCEHTSSLIIALIRGYSPPMLTLWNNHHAGLRGSSFALWGKKETTEKKEITGFGKPTSRSDPSVGGSTAGRLWRERRRKWDIVRECMYGKHTRTHTHKNPEAPIVSQNPFLPLMHVVSDQLGRNKRTRAWAWVRTRSFLSVCLFLSLFLDRKEKTSKMFV